MADSSLPLGQINIKTPIPGLGAVLAEAALKKQLPQVQFEYVTVTFPTADTDVLIPFTVLRPDNPELIRWIDITPGTVYTGGTDTVATVYRSNSPTRGAFTATSIQLRSTVANYSTRLLLFIERT